MSHSESESTGTVMHLHYTCTSEDYLQALRTRRTRSAQRFTAVGCAILLSAAIALFLMVGMIASRIEDPFWTGVAASLFVMMTALLGVSAVVWVWLAGRERYVRRSMWRMFFILVVTILLCYAASNFVPALPPATPRVQQSGGNPWGIVLLVIWCIPIVVLILAIARLRAEVIRANFQSQPAAGQATIADVSPTGLIIQAGDICRMEYKWSAFHRATESRDLFVLFTSPEQFEMIPKRAFANRPQIESFRQILKTNLIDPEQPRSGFEVPVRVLPVDQNQSA